MGQFFCFFFFIGYYNYFLSLSLFPFARRCDCRVLERDFNMAFTAVCTFLSEFNSRLFNLHYKPGDNIYRNKPFVTNVATHSLSLKILFQQFLKVQTFFFIFIFLFFMIVMLLLFYFYTIFLPQRQ